MNGLEINGSLTNEGGGEVHYAIISLIFEMRLNDERTYKKMSRVR